MGSRASRARVIAAVLSAIGLSRCATGQISGLWISPTGGSWSDASKWSSAPNYPDNGGTASFGSAVGSLAINLNTPVSVSGLSFGITQAALPGAGPLSLTGPAVIDVSSRFVPGPFLPFGVNIATAIASTAGLLKTGDGILILSGSNSVSGEVRVTGGTLSLSGVSGLSQATHLTLDGGTFRTTTTNQNSWFLSGSITLGANGGTIGTNQTSAGPTIDGPIDGPGGLTTTLDGNLGTVLFHTVRLSRPNTYTGPTVVRDGQLTLTSSASIASSSGVAVYNSLVIEYSSSGVPLVDKLGDTAPVEVHGGQLLISGPSASVHDYGERIGALSLTGGHCELSSNFASATLTCSSLARSGKATADFLTTGTTTPSLFQIAGAAPPLFASGEPDTPDVGILPWAQYLDANSASSPVTIENGSVRGLRPAEFITSVPTGITHSNLLVTGAAAVAAPTTVNSLTMAVGASLSGSSALTVESGAIHLNTGAQISAPIALAGAEGVIFGRGTIAGAISGSGGLTVAGTASIALTGANSYTGPTVVNGALTISSDIAPGTPGPLGADAFEVTIESSRDGVMGKLNLAGSSTLSFARPLRVKSPNKGPVTISATTAATFSGPIHLDGPLVFSGGSTGAPITVSGKISGSGILERPNNLVLTGDNDFTGGVELALGGLVMSVAAGSDTAFGTGTLLTGATGTLSAVGGPRTLANPISFRSFLGIAGNYPMTFTGPVFFNGFSNSISVGNVASLVTLTGDSVDGLALTKFGPGRLDIKYLRMPAFVNVSAGTLGVIADGMATGASNVGSLSVAAGAALDLTDNAMVYDYPAGGASPSASVRSLLAGGYHGGDWAGSGIISSTAAANASSPHKTAIGYAEAAAVGTTIFFGQSADATSLLLRYTLAGDADLNGRVDLTDFTFLADNFNKSGGAVWLDGDFNYDGNVDLTDFTLLASNFNQTLAAPASVGAAVPDPPAAPTLLLVAMGAGASSRRRRAVRATDRN